ncbi:RNA-guided endonuclease InsQ/TnpB family protein [Streptomyces sp. NPDC058293]|uniref:RNA-guided endonuclease InsQ/TnpB family protein n=1 Tax=Streptomyces sp. NPDC058293 TaxID=3346429 RepID=UPI0036EE8025
MTTGAITEGAGHARYTFRVRLSATARRALDAEWDRCRWLWNECMAKSRQIHAQSRAGGEKLTCGPAQLDKLLTEARKVTPWLAQGACVPQQQVIRDFTKSRAKALKDIKDRLAQHRRAGMPHFKRKRDAKPSMNYTKRGFRLKDGRLHLAGNIAVTVVWSRDLPADPSSVRVYQDTLGHWYVSFVAPAQSEPLPATGPVLGVDWGVKETATTTDDAYDLPHAGHGKRAAQRLAKYQRMMARRRRPTGQPASKGYRKAQAQAAKVSKKIARQREETGRKWAKSVMRGHDGVAVEDFRPKFLAKTTMARKAADAAIAATKRALVETGRKHARDVRLVHPAHTTMQCAQCAARTKHALPLSMRTYACTVCGAVSPRDRNSARVMLVRAGWNPDGAEGARPPEPPARVAA